MADGGLGRDRAGKMLPVTKAGSDCMALSDTSHLLCDWFMGKTSMLKTVYSINQLMDRKGTNAKKESKQAKLDPLAFLHRFADFLNDDLKRLDIDYIALTKDCNTLMQAIKDEHCIEVSARGRGLPKKFDNSLSWSMIYMNKTLENHAPSLIFVIECLLFQDKVWFDSKSNLKKLEKKGVDISQSPMDKVGVFVQKYMAERKMLSPIEEPKRAQETINRADRDADLEAHVDWAEILRSWIAESGMLTGKGQEAALLEAVHMLGIDVRRGKDAIDTSEVSNSNSQKQAGVGKDFARNLRGRWPI